MSESDTLGLVPHAAGTRLSEPQFRSRECEAVVVAIADRSGEAGIPERQLLF